MRLVTQSRLASIHPRPMIITIQEKFPHQWKAFKALANLALIASLALGCNSKTAPKANLEGEAERTATETQIETSTAETSVPPENRAEEPTVTDPVPTSEPKEAPTPKADETSYPAEATTFHNRGVAAWMGDGMSRDFSKALTFFTEAAELGHPGSQHNLGIMYLQGQGIEQDFEKALHWLEKASQSGMPDAQFKAASLYAVGAGAEQSFEKAAQWLTKAAEAGHGEAQANLATLYMKGNGVSSNIVEAVRWYQKAAAQDIPAAQSNLGVFYANGVGVDKNLDTAIEWFQKAAEHYHPTALYNIGSLYERGDYFEKNDKEAFKNYSLAATLGDPDALQALNKLSGSINPLDMANAAREVERIKRNLADKLRTETARIADINEPLEISPSSENTDNPVEPNADK